MAKLFYDDGTEEALDYVEFAHDGKEHREPDHEVMLAKLLIDGDIFVSCQDGRLCVICNDTFGYACADAEPITDRRDIVVIYEGKAKHGWPAVVAWCAKRRKQRPLAPIVTRMKEAGVWDDELESYPDQIAMAHLYARA